MEVKFMAGHTSRNDSYMSALTRNTRSLEKENFELYRIDVKIVKVGIEIIDCMNIFEEAMLELVKRLETDYFNTLEKMIKINEALQNELNLLNRKEIDLSNEFTRENDEFHEILERGTRILKKCEE
jgi:hypothetical protein